MPGGLIRKREMVEKVLWKGLGVVWEAWRKQRQEGGEHCAGPDSKSAENRLGQEVPKILIRIRPTINNT
jgi:hypothetical protein